MLCCDTVYFANPGSFNDPLDCSPTVECDSGLEELRGLLTHLIQMRVNAEVLSYLKKAQISGGNANELARKNAHREAARSLEYIADYASNPDYEDNVVDAESWLLAQEIEHEIGRHYEKGVCCFSTSYSSPLLWSHYGDQHNGVCVGYSTERIPAPHLQKVVYGGGRAIKSSALAKAFLFGDKQSKLELDKDVLLRKAIGWRYESEWRLIGVQGVQDSPLLLKDVTFGLRCSSSVKHAVVRSLSGRDSNVIFYQIYAVRGSYSLRRRKILSDEFNDLPYTAISGMEMFDPSEDEDSH